MGEKLVDLRIYVFHHYRFFEECAQKTFTDRGDRNVHMDQIEFFNEAGCEKKCGNRKREFWLILEIREYEYACLVSDYPSTSGHETPMISWNIQNAKARWGSTVTRSATAEKHGFFFAMARGRLAVRCLGWVGHPGLFRYVCPDPPVIAHSIVCSHIFWRVSVDFRSIEGGWLTACVRNRNFHVVFTRFCLWYSSVIFWPIQVSKWWYFSFMIPESLSSFWIV